MNVQLLMTLELISRRTLKLYDRYKLLPLKKSQLTSWLFFSKNLNQIKIHD